MDKIFNGATVKAEVRAISSKSEAHRALICAALADSPCEIECSDTNADIDATAACLTSLGATVTRTPRGFFVAPIRDLPDFCALDCNESGSTLRFLLPVVASLGADAAFTMRGRLAARPLSPLYELMVEAGVSLSEKGISPLHSSGRLPSGNYRIAANVSSQYVSGLLFALSVAEGKSTLTLEGKLESAPYVLMTLDALRLFGASINYLEPEGRFEIDGRARLSSPGSLRIGGDWSNAAFFLCAGAIGRNPVTVTELDLGTRQGDREILRVLERMGARIDVDGTSVTVFPSKLHAANIDAAQIPDLVPILATVASVAEGESVICNAARLRLKESDRIESVCKTLNSLGALVRETEDGMAIVGKDALSGGTVDSYNDHRIAMSAAVASLACKSPVTVTRFEAINKSYPHFLENWEGEV